ncbi:MAG: phosphatidate cytidylyltransferase [Sphingobacteriia bacterium]|nr:phosphatidate cytidylyltransferase [Sphingobacteriia bacterium]
MNNFITRLLTSFILIPVILFIIYTGGYVYLALIITAAVIMGFEWQDIISKKEHSTKVWYILGIAYVTLPCLSLIWLREQNRGLFYIIWLFTVVWATDIGAYLCGKIIGGWKLAPKISPNKTWSGLIGGIICASLVGFAVANYKYTSLNYNSAIMISAMLAIYAQIGDLIESAIKRYFDVKDSGKIIPGHGGLLDRVDSLILAAPKFALFIIIFQGNVTW